MHLWLPQLAVLCSHSDNGRARALPRPSWKGAQRAAGAALVGPGPGQGRAQVMGQERMLGMSPAWQQRSPARSPLGSLAPRVAGVKGQVEMGGSRNRRKVEGRKKKKEREKIAAEGSMT